MPEHPAAPRQEGAANGPSADAAEDTAEAPDGAFATLRTLLVGPEQQEVAALRARLDDPERRAQDIGAVLPRVLVQHAQDPGFTRALTPSIEKALTSSVRRNPRPLADALFPVMGPAIRKAVAAGLAGMVESLNRTLELALSRRSLRWRIEAWRTGRSFAEVVLSKTLVYRVEQVFLIDRETGLLLLHVQAEVNGVRDADMVSGMLTAIRDFVKDSFQVAEQASLESLEVGDLNVWIEPGPHATLAAVIRGVAPREYRRMLSESVETLHLQFSEPLASFNGDASPLEDARPILEACLQTQFLTEAEPPPRRGARVVLALAGAAALVWLVFTVRGELRWRRYLEALRSEPGITVVSAERSRGRFLVTGLRDPLAADPVPLLAAAGLSSDDVVGRWTAYQALEPEIVLTRVREVLNPPDGVTLALEDGVLSSSGPAPAAWIAEARRVAPLLAGVRRFDAGASLEPALRAAVDALQGEVLLFVKGAARLVPGQEATLERLTLRVRELGALADAVGLRLRLDIVGHTDEDGLAEANLPLSRTRAEFVRGALAAAASPALELRSDGVGSASPVASGRTEAEMQRNRRVTVTVTMLQ